MSPFFANTGQDAPIEQLMSNTPVPKTNPPDANKIKTYLDNVSRSLQHHLRLAQERYKVNADKHRLAEPEYAVNEQVLVSTRNIRTNRPTKKLDYTYIGPFRIKRKINSVAYEIDLPPNYKIHNVFHVKLIKKYVPSDNEHVIPPPPIQTNEYGYIIEKIIDVKRKGRGYQYLIKWLDYGDEDNTWETRSTINDDDLLREWHSKNADKPTPFPVREEEGNNVTNDVVEHTFATYVDSPLVESSVCNCVCCCRDISTQTCLAEGVEQSEDGKQMKRGVEHFKKSSTVCKHALK